LMYHGEVMPKAVSNSLAVMSCSLTFHRGAHLTCMLGSAIAALVSMAGCTTPLHPATGQRIARFQASRVRCRRAAITPQPALDPRPRATTVTHHYPLEIQERLVI
jgi:hypothetical protein